MRAFKNTARTVRLASVSILAAGAAACAPSFKADVSRFQAELPAPAGETFVVVADDPALAGGLEFALYANEVEEEMTNLGYIEAASPDEASLLVRFDYGVDNGRERIRTTGRADPFFSPWYGYRSRFYRRPVGYWGFGFHDPFFGGPEVRSYTVYTSEIDLKIDRAETGERLFEGKAQALSRSNRLPHLVPNLVDAMFTDFPGNSGETVRITIKPEETKSRPIND